MNEPYAHRRCALCDRPDIYNITRCYGKHVTVFAVAVAAGDIIKYQSFVYGSFVRGIHVRYNNIKYHDCESFKNIVFEKWFSAFLYILEKSNMTDSMYIVKYIFIHSKG